jgi:hypothetical protein
LLLVAVLLLSIIFAAAVVFITVRHAADFGFFDVPIASWFVLGLIGFLLSVDGLAIFWRWKFGRAKKSLAAANRKPAADPLPILAIDDIPVVSGFQNLNRPEFVVIVQALFRAPPAAKSVALSLLPDGWRLTGALPP